MKTGKHRNHVWCDRCNSYQALMGILCPHDDEVCGWYCMGCYRVKDRGA